MIYITEKVCTNICTLLLGKESHITPKGVKIVDPKGKDEVKIEADEVVNVKGDQVLKPMIETVAEGVLRRHQFGYTRCWSSKGITKHTVLQKKFD